MFFISSFVIYTLNQASSNERILLMTFNCLSYRSYSLIIAAAWVVDLPEWVKSSYPVDWYIRDGYWEVLAQGEVVVLWSSAIIYYFHNETTEISSYHQSSKNLYLISTISGWDPCSINLLGGIYAKSFKLTPSLKQASKLKGVSSLTNSSCPICSIEIDSILIIVIWRV